MKTKHTKGEWELSKNFNQGIRVLVGQDNPITMTNICSVSGRPSDKEVEANAKLIAEAGTVANECGLSPKQLLEQRNDFLAVSKMIKSNNLQFGFDSSKRRILRLEKEEWELLELVIKKATE